MWKQGFFNVAVGASLLLGVTHQAAAEDMAEKAAMQGTTVQAGQLEVSVLPVVQRTLKTSVLLPKTESQREAMAKTYPEGTLQNFQNVLLIKSGKLRLLVDTGYPDTTAELLARLATRGVQPEDVSHVLITHSHRDHVGGLTKDGKALFPKAQVLLTQPELDWWQGKEKDALSAYAGRVLTIAPDKPLEALPQVAAVEAYGHTPGHVGVLVSGGETPFFFWADLVHAWALQAQEPDVAVSFDDDPDKAVAARKRLLQRAESEGWQVAGSHMPTSTPFTLKLEKK